MSYRSLTIGSGAGNDLNLDDYGYCNLVVGELFEKNYSKVEKFEC